MTITLHKLVPLIKLIAKYIFLKPILAYSLISRREGSILIKYIQWCYNVYAGDWDPPQ